MSEGWPWDASDSPRHCFYYLLTMTPRGCVLGRGRGGESISFKQTDIKQWWTAMGTFPRPKSAEKRKTNVYLKLHLWRVTTQLRREKKREKKIPTAALERFFFSRHLIIWTFFAVKDTTGEQEKTAVSIKVHFFVYVFCANTSSWHSLFKDGRGTGWMLNCYVRQIVASDNQQPPAPSLTCRLRPNITQLSSDRISLLQVGNYFFSSIAVAT